jgi:chemotaxis-related protein WspD
MSAVKSPGLAVSKPEAGELRDCWNKIGVMGDSSCGELAQVVHCRNCPVYSAAGARLLDRPLPADYRREWTEHFSRAKAQATQGKISTVIFRIGEEWLALPTRVFQEITERRVIHSLPHRRNGIVLGLINIRGELQICVSLARLLGIPEANGATASGMPSAGQWSRRAGPEAGAPNARQNSVHNRLMVTEWQGSILTFPVDEIECIHRYLPEELKNIPATVARANPGFSLGLLEWEGRMVGCLDDDLVFSTLNRSLA